MFFRTKDEFDLFSSACRNNRIADGTVPVTISVNNTDSDDDIYAFLTFRPIRGIDGFGNDYYKRFTMKIEEA